MLRIRCSTNDKTLKNGATRQNPTTRKEHRKLGKTGQGVFKAVRPASGIPGCLESSVRAVLPALAPLADVVASIRVSNARNTLAGDRGSSGTASSFLSSRRAQEARLALLAHSLATLSWPRRSGTVAGPCRRELLVSPGLMMKLRRPLVQAPSRVGVGRLTPFHVLPGCVIGSLIRPPPPRLFSHRRRPLMHTCLPPRSVTHPHATA